MRTTVTRWWAGRPRWRPRSVRRDLLRIERKVDDLSAALRAIGTAQHATDTAQHATDTAQHATDTVQHATDTVPAIGTVLSAPAAPVHVPVDVPVEPSVVEEVPDTLWQLIRIADRLADLTARAAPVDPEQAAAVLRWLDRQLPAVLEAAGLVAVADTSGPVDLDRHEVVASRSGPVTAEEIAETVRVGYQWRGALLRTQQIVTTCPDSVASST
ncbi:hypothetical protein O7623_15600 [Solwaraspora sp. WMMD791]|uniref:hypothetical protein n=1 Tax=Solwaraspora sp. WMMD791 TaxID=3016086 RepID=UPI00249C8263|nr:hypothetical protein [Solwaraspora sp. WMMD791]WFE24862.1 hypothetical protein O7623_15600 [Solwaraspora sp. WMMD791]